MKYRHSRHALLLATAGLAFGLTACGDPASPKASTSAVYVLATVDGNTLPCCGYTTTTGKDTSVVLTDGTLILGPHGSYDWTKLWWYTWQDSLTHMAQGVDSTVGRGLYTRQGDTLVLQDSTSGAVLKAVLHNGSVEIQRAGHVYAFAPQPPPHPEGNWALESCTPSGESSDCQGTDAAGGHFTETRGFLDVGHFQPDGRYEWQHLHAYTRPDGGSTVTTLTEDGSYTWDGVAITLTPDDPTAYANAIGTMNGNGYLTVTRTNRVYTFMRFIGAPGS